LWSSDQPKRPVLDLALARAAPIVIVLLLLHSVLDFPLRISALSVLFAIACAYLIAPRRIEDGVERSDRLAKFASGSTVSLRNRY
jgi:hypothetical protein